jgi:hypothetical protein
MEKTCLNDRNEYPDDEVLSRYLGAVKNTWDSLIDYVAESNPDFTGEWRYYNDGKSWLYKLTSKKKTICWISVYDKKFKTTFYFTDKAEDLIKSSSELNKEHKDQFFNGKRYGKIRGLTIEIKKATDLSATRALIEIKLKLK